MLLVVNNHNIENTRNFATHKAPQPVGSLAFYGSLNLIIILENSNTDPY